MRKHFVFFSLFIIFLFCYHTNTFAASNKDFTLGNNSENIINGGSIAYEDGLTYCSDQNAAQYLYVLKNDKKTLLSKDRVSYINLTKDSVFYLKDSKQIYKMNKKTKKKEVIYKSKSEITDFYVVNSNTFYFIADGNIHYYDKKDTILKKDGNIVHIIPTANGVIYAKGKLFNWTLYANDKTITKEVSSFYEVDGTLYFTKDSKDMQASCKELFSTSTPSKKVETYKNTDTETLSNTDTIAENEEATLLTADEENDKVTTLDSSIKSALSSVSTGQENIVKRAMQMYKIKWTPKKNIYSWGKRSVFKKGVTYQGLPYGQAVNASYVPWNTSLSGFISAVNNSSSRMYTRRSTYNKSAPYYSTDCSAFVSWAWQASSRKTTRSLQSISNKVSTQSIYSMQIGDALVYAGSHTVLVTDVGYYSNGNLAYIEITEQTPPKVTQTRYGAGGDYTLSKLTSRYFNSHYRLYRYKNRTSVKYTHNCNVRLDGDTCSKCLSKQKITGLSKSNGTISTVTLSWDKEEGVDGYKVYRSTSANSGFVKIATLTGKSNNRFKDTNLDNNKTYYYKVRGYDGDNHTQYSSVISFKTSDIAPDIVDIYKKDDGIHIVWNKTAGASSYRIYRKTINSDYERLSILDNNDTSYIDTEADTENNTVYTYKVIAYQTIDGKNYPSKSKTRSWIRPSVITTTEVQTSGNYIKWNAVKNADSYLLYRKPVGGTWERLLFTEKTSYTDKKALSGISYVYVLRVVYNSNFSAVSNVTDPIKDDWSEVEIPSMKSASLASNGSKITWTKINKCSGYYLYRKESGKNWQKVATVSGTSYTDTSASSYKFYYYSTKAYSSAGNETSTSEKSSNIARKAKLSVSATNHSNNISIKWSNVSASSYRLYRRVANSSNWQRLTITNKTSFTDKTASYGVKYVYAVSAFCNGESAANLTLSNSITHELFIPTVKVKKNGRKATITWNKITGATSYYVYCRRKGQEWKRLAQISGRSYTYKVPKAGQYYFCARAVRGNVASGHKTSKVFKFK